MRQRRYKVVVLTGDEGSQPQQPQRRQRALQPLQRWLSLSWQLQLASVIGIVTIVWLVFSPMLGWLNWLIILPALNLAVQIARQKDWTLRLRLASLVVLLAVMLLVIHFGGY